MNGFWKNKKGITLIVLSVTIITVLLLAGIIIVTLTGDNGILKRTKKAIVLSEVGEIEEKIKLKVLNEGENEKITGKLSKNNKEKIEMIKDKLPVCYDGIKEYNKIQNYSFDNGLDGMETLNGLE